MPTDNTLNTLTSDENMPTPDTRVADEPAPRPRPRADKKVTVTEVNLNTHGYRYRIEVEHEEGVFVENCITSEDVRRYMRALDAGAFPVQIDIQKEWQP